MRTELAGGHIEGVLILFCSGVVFYAPRFDQLVGSKTG